MIDYIKISTFYDKVYKYPLNYPQPFCSSFLSCLFSIHSSFFSPSMLYFQRGVSFKLFHFQFSWCAKFPCLSYLTFISFFFFWLGSVSTCNIFSFSFLFHFFISFSFCMRSVSKCNIFPFFLYCLTSSFTCCKHFFFIHLFFFFVDFPSSVG